MCLDIAADFAAGRGGLRDGWCSFPAVGAAVGRILAPLDSLTFARGSEPARSSRNFGAACFARVTVAESPGGCSGAGEGAILLLRETDGFERSPPLSAAPLGMDWRWLDKPTWVSAVRRSGEADSPRISRRDRGEGAAGVILSGSASVREIVIPSRRMRSSSGLLRNNAMPFSVSLTHSPKRPLPCWARPCLTSAAVSGCGRSEHNARSCRCWVCASVSFTAAQVRRSDLAG